MKNYRECPRCHDIIYGWEAWNIHKGRCVEKMDKEARKEFRISLCVFIVSLGIIAFLIFSIIFLLVFGQITNANKHYWNGSGIVDTPLGAPNGVYDVLPTGFDEDKVFFPMCSHSYGYLHGCWKFDNTSGHVWFATSAPWLTPCMVRLRDNVIVESWKK